MRGEGTCKEKEQREVAKKGGRLEFQKSEERVAKNIEGLLVHTYDSCKQRKGGTVHILKANKKIRVEKEEEREVGQRGSEGSGKQCILIG